MPIPAVILYGLLALTVGCWFGVRVSGAWRPGLVRWARRLSVVRRAIRTACGIRGERGLGDELAFAIANGQLFLVHQPKLHTRTGTIPAVETLVRWQHPVRGLIGPNDFVGIAEEIGQIRNLTEWVILRALEEQRLLAGQGHVLAFNVNISARILADRDFADWALAALSGSAGPVGFEITETAMIADPDGALRNLHLFAEAGIRIAIDDYGAGLSSLAYLKQLPADELKIDRMFVSGLSSSHRDPLLVRSTIDLAHALDMQVTAEGVDSSAALALLRVMGCDLVQGFLISTPLPCDELRAFLDDRADRVAPAAERSFNWFQRGGAAG